MNKTINKLFMNSMLSAGAFMLLCFPALAQEGNSSQNTTLDTSTVVSNAATIEKGLSDLCSSLVPFVISVILSVLVVFLIKKVAFWLADAYDRRTGNY